MIKLTKLDGEFIMINADEIEQVEYNFDSTIKFRSGSRILVQEKPEMIRELVIEYRQDCFRNLIDKIPNI